MKKRIVVKDALTRAQTYRTKPEIPPGLIEYCKPWTHCEIRAYHQCEKRRKPKGKAKKSRRIRGFIFIFFIDNLGNVSQQPIRIMHKFHMTHRQFVGYARRLTRDTDQALHFALAKNIY
ncbi:MAG: hypothetical protein U9Q12_00765 [Patescibacteria group bacterium]|nr:hypothetical protein [Patescibacteria group bacterium]